MTQLEQALNEHLERIRGIRYCGIWEHDGSCCLNDDAGPRPTSFSWHKNETLGQALDRLHAQLDPKPQGPPNEEVSKAGRMREKV